MNKMNLALTWQGREIKSHVRQVPRNLPLQQQMTNLLPEFALSSAIEFPFYFLPPSPSQCTFSYATFPFPLEFDSFDKKRKKKQARKPLKEEEERRKNTKHAQGIPLRLVTHVRRLSAVVFPEIYIPEGIYQS